MSMSRTVDRHAEAFLRNDSIVGERDVLSPPYVFTYCKSICKKDDAFPVPPNEIAFAGVRECKK